MPRRPRISHRHGLKIDIYKLVTRAVEEGIELGWRRAHKHTDSPGAQEIKCQITTAVMNEMSDVFVWPSIYED